MRKELPSGILPWTKSCFVCGESNPRGLRLKSRLENGRVVLDYTTRETDLGWKHAVHGGVLMTLLDEVMTWAAMIASAKPCVAAELTVRLVAPVEPDRELRAESPVPDSSRKMIGTEATVSDPDGTVVAKATGKYLPMRDDQFGMSHTDFVWDSDSLQPADLVDGP